MAASLGALQTAVSMVLSFISIKITSVYLGLHIGPVFYGNIGSEGRLDFTVVGPAVNEAARIASMCRSVDREVVLSSDFVAATPPPSISTPAN